MKKRTEAAVIGAGMWGSVLAHLLALKGHEVRAWEFNKAVARSLRVKRTHPALPGFKLAAGVKVFTGLEEAVRSPGLLVMAVDSRHVRGLARQLNVLLKDRPLPLIVAVTKGIEAGSLKTVCGSWKKSCRGAAQDHDTHRAQLRGGSGRRRATKVVLAGLKRRWYARPPLMEGGPLKFSFPTTGWAPNLAGR